MIKLFLAPSNAEFRDWSLPSSLSHSSISTEKDSNAEIQAQNEDTEGNLDLHLDPTQDKQRFIAEIIYIMRPICHCKKLFLFKLINKQ